MPEPAPSADVAAVEAVDAGAPDLPDSWTTTVAPKKPFAVAIREARATRAKFEVAAAATMGARDGGPPDTKQFERANGLLDLGSREFAAAYHAADAPPGGKVDALSGATTMILAWSRKLDELGLARAPASYKNSPVVALTFEDVAVGPAKRWREEGAALAALCVMTARANAIDSQAAKACVQQENVYGRVVVRRTPSADGGSGCACDPGDPLCSASMSGWCGSH
jgi:hypothetical protein